MNWEKNKDHRQDAKTPRKDLSQEEESLATSIVDAAVKVHSVMGPGLLERIYEICMIHELTKRGHKVESQVAVPLYYDGVQLDAGLRLDLVVDGIAVLELKSVDHTLPVHEGQLITYLKLSGLRLGFLLNFNVALMKDGIKRRILQRKDGGLLSCFHES